MGSGSSAKGLTWKAQQKGHSCETLDFKKCTVNESSETQANTMLETYVKFNALEDELIWLLRKDPAQQKMAVSYYENGKCQHYFIEQLDSVVDVQKVGQNIVFQQAIAFEKENFQDRHYQ